MLYPLQVQLQFLTFDSPKRIYLLHYILIGILASSTTMKHVISLPSKGTAFSFQPNLLTSFSRPGPYNIQLLARHMDALLQIPHALELDFATASVLLYFPYRHPVNPSYPYQQVHDEVLSIMPLSATPSASDPTLIDSSEQ